MNSRNNYLDIQEESDNLRYMWDRHSEDFLERYLRTGFYSSENNPQHLLTRQIVGKFVYGNNSEKIDTESDQKISLLDIGCGTGNYYDGFQNSGLSKDLRYTGIDISPKVIQVASRIYPNVDFRVGNILKLGFPESSLDIVMVNHVFEHLAPGALLKALNEALKVAKRLIIINFFSERDIAGHEIKKVELYHWNTLSRPKLKEFFESRNLASEVIDTYPHYAHQKIEFVDRRGNHQSFSTWIIYKHQN